MSIYDIYAIGNALLDTEYDATDEFLARHQIPKGRMSLVDEVRMRSLRKEVENNHCSVSCGGSAANTVYAAQAFGCKNFFAGLVRDDNVGRAFNNDLSEIGVDVLPPSSTPDLESGQCLIFVTEDGERSMNTNLGISHRLSESLVDESTITSSTWTFIEGYLASSPTGYRAATKVRELADTSLVKTSITLSDVLIVDSYRDQLQEMIGNGVDLVFCNIAEAQAWCHSDDEEVVFERMLDIAGCAVVTQSEKGCYVVVREGWTEFPGFPVESVDDNGAGDMFAGAFLAALCHGMDYITAAQFANYAASHIVTQYGARLPNLTTYKSLQERYYQDGSSI